MRGTWDGDGDQCVSEAPGPTGACFQCSQVWLALTFPLELLALQHDGKASLFVLPLITLYLNLGVGEMCAASTI